MKQVIRKVALYFGVIYAASAVLGFVPFLGGSYNLETEPEAARA